MPIDKTQTKKQTASPWQTGCLFHNFSRYPHKPDAPKVDRLASILKMGIVAPAACTDGAVCSDLNLKVSGLSEPYDNLVFLHRFGEMSWLYTLSEPGRFTVFVDPELPVLTPEDMGEHWLVLCQDEVYVRNRVPMELINGIVIHPKDADAVLDQFLSEFKRLGIRPYLPDGGVINAS